MEQTSTTRSDRSRALVFDGYRAWRSNVALPSPHGLQSLTCIWVKNNQLASAKAVYNVSACIEYLYNGSEEFVVRNACWWYEPTGKMPISWPVRIDLEANESQCVPVFMQPIGHTGLKPPWPQSAMDQDNATRTLRPGRWTIKVTITADSVAPLVGQIEFTVYQEQGLDRLSVGCQPPMGDASLPLELRVSSSSQDAGPPPHKFRFSDIWRWIGGKWQWGSLFGAAIGLGRAGEYGVGLLLLLMSGVAASSKIFHWKGPHPSREPAIRIIGYCSVAIAFCFLTIVTLNMKGSGAWSHLQPVSSKAAKQPTSPAAPSTGVPKHPDASSPQPATPAPLPASSSKTETKAIPLKPTAPAVVNNCPNGICISGGTVNGNPTVINNPVLPEQTWQLSIARCDEWMRELDLAGSGKVSIGHFISDNDASRVVNILVACFNRSGRWKAMHALLPANPDGVQIGAAVNSPALDVLESGLHSIGFRVPGPRDIRVEYGTEIDIIVGRNPIEVKPSK
jgi:hypothetical protein